MRKRIAIALLTTLLFTVAGPRVGADQVLEEIMADAALHFELTEKKLVLKYVNGATDTLRGKTVEIFLAEYPELNGFLASVYRVEIRTDENLCVVHSIFVYDARRARLTTVSCR